MRLSEFLDALEFHTPKKSSEYVGKKEKNPVMVLEENVAVWLRQTDLDDLQMALTIFQNHVCIQGYPAIYSPQFWIANASLTAIYDVLNGYLKTPAGLENERVLSDLLFELWIKLLNAGPGSTHLHMLNIILKSHDDLLWKYMESLKGDNLKTLVRTLRTDFVYKEEVSPEHYATLMETHIDKVFRSIFSSDQFEETRRDLLDLQIYYLSRMNHVPPHIGPRLSHLCFLICNRYELENPYLGLDDWVLMRNHLKFIKDVITNSSFTKASEAQYRAPIILEKILHAAVVDKMLDVMFKDFMVMLQTITTNQNSKKCVRLYTVYQTGLFEHIDLKKGFEECPYFLFKQCIQALAQLANSNMLEAHIEDFIITTQNNFLLKFIKLSANESGDWHQLFVNYIVSGRHRLVTEAGHLLSNSVLSQNGVIDWKRHSKECRMLIDIIADLPREFLQDDEQTTCIQSAEAYSKFVQKLFGKVADIEECIGVQTEIRPNVHRCIVKCLEKDTDVKASVCLACVKSDIPDFKDLIYVREVLFIIEKLLKDDDCPRHCDVLTQAVSLILKSCLQTFRDKGYIGVDFNSLLMSITLTCVTIPDQSEEEMPHIEDIYANLYHQIVPVFVQMHCDKGSLHTICSLVSETLSAMKEAILKGSSCHSCAEFIQMMGIKSFKLLTDHTKLIIELFIDWCCMELKDIIKQLYSVSPECLVGRFQDLFDLLTKIDVDQSHHVLDVLYKLSMDYIQLFQDAHIQTLVEIYSLDNAQSQEFIIQIILQVLEHNPKLLIPFVDRLIDETRFSTTFFRERCRILTTLLAMDRDLSMKTEDFLMKYITHTDETVALTAMHSLVPLIKPNMNAPRKARLKVLLKSIKCLEVKTMCENLANEQKTNSRKSQSKPLTTAVATKSVPAKPQPVRPVVKTPPPAPKSSPSPVKQPITNIRPVVMSPPPATTASPLPEKTPQNNSDVRPLLKTPSPASKASPSLAKQPITTNSVHSEALKKPMVSSRLFTPIQSVEVKSQVEQMDKKEQIIEPLKPDNTFNTHYVSNHVQTSGKSSSPLPDIKKEDAQKQELCNEIPNLKYEQKTNEDRENVTVKTDADLESGALVTSFSNFESSCDSKPVGIYGSEQDRFKLTAFSSVLKDAGFDNDVVCTSVDVSLLESVRVVILCYSGVIEGQQVTQITNWLGGRKPVVVIKLDRAGHSPGIANKLGTKCVSIRMYTKPGETTLRGHWPALKFYELLMHLNYQGILPVDHLLSQDFREWWKPQTKQQLVSGDRVTEKRSVAKNSAATVFFSYHWGKQRQVEPLYEYLTKQGISCWVGLQQVGGSESLYNKISQGIQECRVVLACITSQYTSTQNCQQEINIALGLNRPVIPLLVKTNWPIRDDIGQKLLRFEHLRLNLSPDGKIDVKTDSIKPLLNRLNKLIPSETNLASDRNEDICQKTVDHGLSLSGGNNVRNSLAHGKAETKETKQSLNKLKSPKLNSVTTQSPKNSESLHKSMSMYELEKSRNLSKIYAEEELRVGSKSSMELDRRKSQYDVPDGVMVDEFGYTVKTNRSKSCVIL